MRALLFAVALAACTSPAVERVSFGELDFDVPDGWRMRDLSTHSRTVAQWTPENNGRKESITIVRSERPGAASSPPQLYGAFTNAHRALPSGDFGPPLPFRTKHGLTGIRIDGSFVPPGKTEPYRRIHAALAEGTAVVHVLYTARTPDPDHFDAVIDSLSPKGN